MQFVTADNTLFLKSLETIERIVKRDHVLGNHQLIKSEWFLRVTSGRLAQQFFKGVRGNHISKIAVTKFCGRIFHEFYSSKGTPLVVSKQAVRKVNKAAKVLMLEMDGLKGVPLPEPANTDFFADGLDVMTTWKPPQGIPTNERGNAERRMVMHQLAVEFANHFSQVPCEYLHELLLLVWPETHGRTVSNYVALNRQSILQQAEEKREETARSEVLAFTSLNQAMQGSRVISVAAQDLMGKFMIPAGRLQKGKRAFPTDSERLRFCLALCDDYDDSEIAQAIRDFILVTAQEFGLPL